jgi:sRNA-binding carbon storage regulator CsrA
MSEAKHTSVILDIRHGESVRVSDLVRVQLLHKSGNLVRLRVTAPRDLSILKDSTVKPDEAVPSMAT